MLSQQMKVIWKYIFVLRDYLNVSKNDSKTITCTVLFKMVVNTYVSVITFLQEVKFSTVKKITTIVDTKTLNQSCSVNMRLIHNVSRQGCNEI